MSVTVHFKGGPLGGESRVLREFPGPTYFVPSLRHGAIHRSYGENDTLPPPSISTYRTEEYRARRSFEGLSGEREHEFVWVHPSEGLERQVDDLRQQLKSKIAPSPILSEIDAQLAALEQLEGLDPVTAAFTHGREQALGTLREIVALAD